MDRACSATELHSSKLQTAGRNEEFMNFASDNTAGIAAPILEAIGRANTGYAWGYGNDDWTKRVEKKLADVFEHEVAVFLVPTGTVANSLALAHMTPPWGAVLCHEISHVATDECGAPEFFGGGMKLIGLKGDGAKISADTLRGALEGGAWGGPHHVTPAALTLSQATECGTVYRVSEVGALAEIAHKHKCAVHMDGARLGNALARMNCSPAEITWRAGIDALSFGATKGGAMCAEAIMFFDPKRGEEMQSRRKRGGALPSKHRFVAAQMEAFLADDLWLKLARHANDMADALSAGLTAAGCKPIWAVEANEIFAPLPLAADKKLKAAGAAYYPWPPAGLDVPADKILVRLVTSFQTTKEDVDKFLAILRA
jgi:threonine aldolase